MLRWMTIAVTVFSLLGCAQQQVVRKAYAPDRIHSLNEFKTFRETSDVIDRVACLEPGDTIPIKLRMESEWLGLQHGEVELVAKRKIFLRITLPENISRERMQKIISLDDRQLTAMTEPEKAALFDGVMLYLSRDALHWAPLNNRKALKEVFDIQSGTLSAGMGMNATEGLWVALSVELFKR